MKSNRIKKWTIIGTGAALGVSLSTGIAYASAHPQEPTHPTPQPTVTDTTPHRTSSPDLAPRVAHSTNNTDPGDHSMDRNRYHDRTPAPSADQQNRTEYRYHADRHGAWEGMGHGGTDHSHGWGDH